MAMTKAQRGRVAEWAMELADLAAAKDIDVAYAMINAIAAELGIDPNMLPKYAELQADAQSGR